MPPKHTIRVDVHDGVASEWRPPKSNSERVTARRRHGCGYFGAIWQSHRVADSGKEQYATVEFERRLCPVQQ